VNIKEVEVEGLKRHSDKYVWERVEGEGQESHERFKCYRRLHSSKRSVARAWRLWCKESEWIPEDLRVVGVGPYVPSTTDGGAPPLWYKESREYEWESRALAFDDFQDQLDTESEIELRREIRKRRRDTALELQSKALEALELVNLSRVNLSHVASAVRTSDAILAELTESTSAVQLDVILTRLSPEFRDMLVVAMRTVTTVEKIEDRAVDRVVGDVIDSTAVDVTDEEDATEDVEESATENVTESVTKQLFH